MISIAVLRQGVQWSLLTNDSTKTVRWLCVVCSMLMHAMNAWPYGGIEFRLAQFCWTLFVPWWTSRERCCHLSAR